MKKWECTVCGYIHEGDQPPDTCPVCGAGAEYFKELVDAAAPTGTAAPEAVGATGEPEVEQPAVTGFAALVLKFHLHPITVHTPNGVLPLAFVFLIIAVVFGVAAFEQAAFYNLVFVLLTMPMVLVTGYLAWKNRYRGVMTKIFMAKIFASVVVSASLVAMVVWRLVDPQVLASPGHWIYLSLGAVMVAAAGLAGHMGGKLVFKD